MAWNVRRVPVLLAAALLLCLPARPARAQASAATPPAGPPYRVGGEVSRPEKISGDAPVYTDEARQARVVGVVIIEAVIDEQGNVTATKVVKGLPMGLAGAAEEAVRTWKFKPAMLDGRPVPVTYMLTVSFSPDPNGALRDLFQEMLNRHADFAALVRAQRFEEAADLVSSWESAASAKGSANDGSANDDAALARTYVLLAQGRFGDALRQAQSEPGSDPYTTLSQVGVYALQKAASSREVSRREREGIVDQGLQAESLALEVKADGREAIMAKVQLLEMKFRMSSDPEERRQLLAETDQLKARLAALPPQG